MVDAVDPGEQHTREGVLRRQEIRQLEQDPVNLLVLKEGVAVPIQLGKDPENDLIRNWEENGLEEEI